MLISIIHFDYSSQIRGVLTEDIQFHGRLSYAVAHQLVGGATGQRFAVVLPRWGDGEYGGAGITILGDL